MDKEEKGRTCCFTGHRVIPYDDICELAKDLDDKVESMILSGYTHFRTGGALGFDTLAALTVLDLQKKYPQIRLEVCVPCRTQSATYNKRDKFIYDLILHRANSVTLISEKHNATCMQKRNRYMVDGSDICVAFCRKKGGGTAYTVEYATNNHVTVYNLAHNMKYFPGVGTY